MQHSVVSRSSTAAEEGQGRLATVERQGNGQQREGRVAWQREIKAAGRVLFRTAKTSWMEPIRRAKAPMPSIMTAMAVRISPLFCGVMSP